MNKNVILSLTVLLISFSSAAVFAQTTGATDPTIPAHPHVNEVDQRLENQQNRINAGVKDGQLNAAQATRDENRDAKVSQQLSTDEAKNNGHITKAEQRKMNKKLNNNSKKIHKQRKAGAEKVNTTAQ